MTTRDQEISKIHTFTAWHYRNWYVWTINHGDITHLNTLIKACESVRSSFWLIREHRCNGGFKWHINCVAIWGDCSRFHWLWQDWNTNLDGVRCCFWGSSTSCIGERCLHWIRSLWSSNETEWNVYDRFIFPGQYALRWWAWTMLVVYMYIFDGLPVNCHWPSWTVDIVWFYGLHLNSLLAKWSWHRISFDCVALLH